MAARPVQLSLDTDLLDRIDADPIYLKAKERREIEERLAQTYAGEAGSLLDEVEELMGQQSWPND